MSDKKIDNFLSTVYGAAEAKAEKMIREIDRAGDNALREYREELRRSADADRRRERARAARMSAETAAHDESEIRRELLGRREAITNEVFSAIRERLLEYRTTDGYKDALLASAAKTAAQLEGMDGAALLVCEADAGLIPEIESATGVAVRVDSAIKLGGIKGTSAMMECDCTLDASFEAAKADFVRESGLCVV